MGGTKNEHPTHLQEPQPASNTSAPSLLILKPAALCKNKPCSPAEEDQSCVILGSE